MSISKSEFKIIFNKMMKTSFDDNKKIINKISNTGKSGDEQIDSIINNYSSEYINKIMNKITNRGLVGGNTSEANSTNQNKPASTGLPLISVSESSVVPPKTVEIINKVTGSIDKPVSTQVSNSTTSSEVFIPSSGFSDKKDLGASPTSSNVVSTVVPSSTSDIFMPFKSSETSNANTSATSTAVPNSVVPSTTSDIFIPAKPASNKNENMSATSSAVPNSIVPSTTSDVFMPAKNTSETSSVMPGSVTKSMLNSPTSSENRTTTDLPTVSKSDISDVFGNQSSSKQENSSTKMTPKKAVELVLEKNKILKEKEALLENKEKELKNREELVIQVEKDAKAKIDKINGEISELNKIKSELETTIGKLKDEKKSLDNSLSEIELSLDSVNKLQNTESENNTNSILKKIFG